ncbi:MAG TPA: 5-formyltetrahydrofolate cyclo-ligase [Casimicrobiaceae bacterium]|nr:5-formyltetrahydrofolate cyclo-ligase [Casimicrobiaceae bacterium]
MVDDAPRALPTGVSLREAKRALRERVIAARDAIAPGVRALASEAIADRICALESWARARVPLLTLPFRSEWDAAPVAARALAAGKVVALPRVDANAKVLRLHRITDLARDIAPGHLGIPEPRPDCPAIDRDTIDWILIPGVAFDARGHRLGYGGGYYDRLLPGLQRAAHRVAGAFEMQIVDTLPLAPHDCGIDTVVTERRVIDARAHAG